MECILFVTETLLFVHFLEQERIWNYHSVVTLPQAEGNLLHNSQA